MVVCGWNGRGSNHRPPDGFFPHGQMVLTRRGLVRGRTARIVGRRRPREAERVNHDGQ